MRHLFLLMLFALPAHAAEAPPPRYWYRFELVGGKEYSGSSQLSENLLYISLRGEDFLRLENVRQGKSVPAGMGFVFLNPKQVVAVFPINADPAASHRP